MLIINHTGMLRAMAKYDSSGAPIDPAPVHALKLAAPKRREQSFGKFGIVAAVRSRIKIWSSRPA